MDLKTLKPHILRGYVGRRVVLRSFVLTSAVSVVLWLQFIGGADPNSVTIHDCANPELDLSLATNSISNRFLKPILGAFQFMHCQENVNLTVAVVEELVSKQLLSYGAKTLCVGEGSATSVLALRELGFPDACAVYKQSFFSLRQRKFLYGIDHEDSSFDFVLSRDSDKLSVPAILVLQIERILKPGGIGAMLITDDGGSNPNSLIRSATPVSLLLKNSSVVHVAYVNNLALVVFRKKVDKVGYFGHFRLSGHCPSIENNKPFMPRIEPLVGSKPVGFEKRIAYLPKFMDVSSKKQPVYVHVGAGGHLNSLFLPDYPVKLDDFDVYLVDHNTSVLQFHVKKPGVTFVYHPGLAGTNGKANASSEEEEDDSVLSDEGFDFLGWFKETVEFADFVVLKMNTGDVELKFLSDLFQSGAICFVDELFLNCSAKDGEGINGGDCMDLFGDLRSSGVYVHQWWGG